MLCLGKNLIMEQEGKNKRFVLKHFDLLENISMLLFALGVFLVTKSAKYSQYLMWFGGILLSLIYILKSLERPENNDFFDYIILKFAWLGLVIAIFGIIGKVLILEKANLLLWIAFLSMLIGFAGGLQRRFEKREIFEKRDYWRLAIVMVITVLFAIV